MPAPHIVILAWLRRFLSWIAALKPRVTMFSSYSCFPDAKHSTHSHRASVPKRGGLFSAAYGAGTFARCMPVARPMRSGCLLQNPWRLGAEPVSASPEKHTCLFASRTCDASGRFPERTKRALSCHDAASYY